MKKFLPRANAAIHGRVFFLFVALALGLWISSSVRAAPPAPNTPHALAGKEDCLQCHGPGAIKPVTSSHAGRTSATCTSCHPASSETTPPSSPAATMSRGTDACLICHSNSRLTVRADNGEEFSGFVDPQSYATSIHGSRLTCTDCHTTISSFPHQKISIPSERGYSITHYEACKRCHFSNYTKTLDSIHFQTLANGDQQAPVCTDCHGAHTVKHASEPRVGISEACGKCHTTIYEDYSKSVHGSALRDENNGDVPTCTTCHGVHNIQRAVSAAFRLSSTDMCARCHSDEALMKKYGISAQVTQTYLSDFHGKTVSLVRKEDSDTLTDKALCIDCHGIHDILKTNDPDSSVIKANLLKTCQKCHPDATGNFPSAWLSHYEPSLQKASLVYYIRVYYWILIPMMIGGLVLHILLDLWRMARNR